MTKGTLTPPLQSPRKQLTSIPFAVGVMVSLLLAILVYETLSVSSTISKAFEELVSRAADAEQQHADYLQQAFLYSGDGIMTQEQETSSTSIPTSRNATSTSPSSSTLDDAAAASWNISIVVQLSGELGNHLSKIAFGFSVQQLLWEQHGIASHLVLQRQERGYKWISPRRDMQTCFPHFATTNFEAGNTVEFQERSLQQQQWLGRENASQLLLENLISSDHVDQRLLYLSQEVLPRLLTRQDSHHRRNDTHNISFPFIYAQSFASWEYIDRYYDKLKSLFVFDETACCKEVPKANEHVFHFRNYAAEMPRRAKQKGFEELDPNQTAVNDLFGMSHHDYDHDDAVVPTRNQMIAITTRRHNVDAEAYVTWFQQAGWSARIVENQTGTQDFCFLMQAQRDLVGMARSSYVVWASLLGNARRVRLYSINSTETQRAFGDEGIFLGHQWKTPELKNRIHFATITPRDTLS